MVGKLPAPFEPVCKARMTLLLAAALMLVSQAPGFFVVYEMGGGLAKSCFLEPWKMMTRGRTLDIADLVGAMVYLCGVGYFLFMLAAPWLAGWLQRARPILWVMRILVTGGAWVLLWFTYRKGGLPFQVLSLAAVLEVMGLFLKGVSPRISAFFD